MKLAIISDTHFGDETCTLVTRREGKTGIGPGPKYDAFRKAAGTANDFLVLAGDIFDFSIASYEKAYEYGRAFFELISRDNIAREMIYLAGNHDADIWHVVQHQRSVIRRIEKGLLPVKYDHSVAGIIDDRTESHLRGFWLNKTSAKADGKSKYGDMFLDYITGSDNPTVFNFAYPNLYIATDAESVLVTHGQYLEQYWSLLGDIAVKIAHDDLRVGEVDVEEMVQMNFPLNQLACTGLGQAGVLTDVVRKVEIEVKGEDTRRVSKYLNRLERVVDKMTDYGWLKEMFTDYLLRKAKDDMLAAVGKMEKTRYSEEFIYKKEVQDRFRGYYFSSLLEIGAINEDSLKDNPPGFNIPAPSRVVFGHTHQPIPWNAKEAPKIDAVSSRSPRPLTLHNTGGWLATNGSFCGAEVFKYQTGEGFSSVGI